MDEMVYLMVYLAELRQLASVVRHFEDYTRIMKRVERVCDSIEHDLGLSQLHSVHDACGGPVSKVRG